MNDHSLTGVSIAVTSKVRVAAILELLVIGN